MFKLKSVFAMTAFLVIFGGALSVRAQEGPIAGGYADTDVADAGVIAAANFAVKRQGQKTKSKITKLTIKNAQVQVVAGLNYQLCLEVSVKKPGRKAVKQFVKVVVYKNLQNVHSLTSWTLLKDVNGC